MSKTWILAVGLFGFALASAGCPKKSNNDTNVGTSDASASSSASTPPPPKCEAFSENCSATASTQAKVAGANVIFVPPAGWLYAQQATETISKPKAGDGIIGMAAFEATDKELVKVRGENYDRLVGALEVTLPEKNKKKWTPNWDKPDQTRKSGDMEIKLWQLEKAKRNTKTGFVLVIIAADASGKKVLGLAFAPEGDDKAVEAISQSLETIGPGAP
ncbi:MAG: hypothetical protein U0271_20140 [Polyangiaceae bacterium]